MALAIATGRYPVVSDDALVSATAARRLARSAGTGQRRAVKKAVIWGDLDFKQESRENLRGRKRVTGDEFLTEYQKRPVQQYRYMKKAKARTFAVRFCKHTCFSFF